MSKKRKNSFRVSPLSVNEKALVLFMVDKFLESLKTSLYDDTCLYTFNRDLSFVSDCVNVRVKLGLLYE